MNAVRYLAIAAMLVINVVLLGLNLQKHEIFPFSPDSAGEVSQSLPVDAGQ